MRKILTSIWFGCFLVFVVALGFRLPFVHTVYWRTPDAAEYIDVGRNLVAGKGVVQTIRANYLGNWPVVTSAFRGRPIGTALVLAGILTVTEDLYHAQLVFLILGAFNCVLVFLLARQFLLQKMALVVAILVSINPNFLISNRLLISEVVFMTLVYLSLLVWFLAKRSRWMVIILGALVGLAYLTRFEAIILLVLMGWQVRKDRSVLILLIGGFLLTTGWYFWGNYQVNGNPLFSYNYYHYQMREFWTVLGSDFDHQFASPLVFIKDNFWWVGGQLLNVTVGHLRSIFGITSLGILSVFLPLTWRLRKKPIFILLWFSLGVILVYSSLWSAIFERERHFFVVYSLLLILIFAAIQRLRKGKLFWGIILATILIYCAYDGHRVVWARTVDANLDNWSSKQKGELFEWSEKNIPWGEVVAVTDPSLVNLFTGRAAVRLPSSLEDQSIMMRFVHKYQVKYLFWDDPKRFPYLDKSRIVICLDGVCVYKF